MFPEFLIFGTYSFQAGHLAERYGVLRAFRMVTFRMKIRLPVSRLGVQSGRKSVSDNADRFVKEIHFFSGVFKIELDSWMESVDFLQEFQ